MAAAVDGPRTKARKHAAAWLDSSGQVERYVDARTMCLEPRRPGRLRAAVDGFITVLPCKKCRGCRERTRRHQAARLVATYGHSPGPIFYARIQTTAANAARLCDLLHRRPGLELYPGLYRDGRNLVGVLGRARAVLENALCAAGAVFRIFEIRKPAVLAAWHIVTQGVLVAREAYGANLNRWYARGLARLPALTWSVDRIPYEKGFDRRRSPRAWRDDGARLVPPEWWGERRRGPIAISHLYATAPDSDSVREVDRLVNQVSAGFSVATNQPIRPLLPSRVVLSRYEEDRRRAKIRDDAARAATDKTLGSLLVGSRYASSNHPVSHDPWRGASEVDLARAGPDGRPAWMDRQLADARKEPERGRTIANRLLADSLAALKRMAEAARGRENPKLADQGPENPLAVPRKRP